AGGNSPFEWNGDQAWFRGLRVHHTDVSAGGRTFRIARLQDAADLLDDPEFARRFTEEDVAPYGVELWPSAIMLAEHILAKSHPAPRKAVELGAGVGLGSIAAAAAGWRVVATDNDPTALRFAAYNAAINGVQIERFELLDWRRAPRSRDCSYVFAADVLYQSSDHAVLLRCIDALLAYGGTGVIVDPNRGVADPFQSIACKAGFEVTVAAARASWLTGEPITGRVFTLHRVQ
ncbi:MAG: methyltransferase, partial [Phycisphaerae bacterium]